MNHNYIFTDYFEAAMATAEYEKYDDSTVGGRVRECSGVLGFGNSLEECKTDLRSALEGWVLLGIHQGHELPVIGGINLNEIPSDEPMVAV
ncbi:MAG: type II toxin-antitoxin system HicB family antitoxin [Ignavibacteriota bacterium]